MHFGLLVYYLLQYNVLKWIAYNLIKLVRVIIILIFGILSYLIVFLPGFFLFVNGEKKDFLEKTISSSKTSEKADMSTLKNPGKAPPPK